MLAVWVGKMSLSRRNGKCGHLLPGKLLCCERFIDLFHKCHTAFIISPKVGNGIWKREMVYFIDQRTIRSQCEHLIAKSTSVWEITGINSEVQWCSMRSWLVAGLIFPFGTKKENIETSL